MKKWTQQQNDSTEAFCFAFDEEAPEGFNPPTPDKHVVMTKAERKRYATATKNLSKLRGEKFEAAMDIAANVVYKVHQRWLAADTGHLN